MSGIYPRVKTWALGQGSWARVVEKELTELRRAVDRLSRKPTGSSAAVSSGVPSKVASAFWMVDANYLRGFFQATSDAMLMSHARQEEPILKFTLSWEEDSGDPDNPTVHPSDITFVIGDRTTTLSAILDRLDALEA